MRRSKGTVAVLALLLSVLFSAAQAPAGRAAAGSRPSAIGHNEGAKSGALVRTAGRNQDEERHRSDPLTSPGAPGVVTATVARRDQAGFHPADAASAVTFPSLSYRARAPPAAA